MQGPLVELCERLDPEVPWSVVVELLATRVKERPLRFDLFELWCEPTTLAYRRIRSRATKLTVHTVVTHGSRPASLHPNLAAGETPRPSYGELSAWSDSVGFVAPFAQQLTRFNDTDVPMDVWLRFYKPDAFPDFTYFHAYTRLLGHGANPWGELWPSQWVQRHRWRLEDREHVAFFEDALREVAGNGRWLIWRHELSTPQGMRPPDPRTYAAVASTPDGFASLCIVPRVSQAPTRSADEAFVALAKRFETGERALPPFKERGVQADARGELKNALGALFPLDAFESIDELEAFALSTDYIHLVGWESSIEQCATFFNAPTERICQPIDTDVATQSLLGLTAFPNFAWLSGLTVEQVVADRTPTANGLMRLMAKTSGGWLDVLVHSDGRTWEEIGYDNGYHYKDPIAGHWRVLKPRGPVRAEVQHKAWSDSWRLRIDVFEPARFWQLDELAVWGEVYGPGAPRPDSEPGQSLDALSSADTLPPKFQTVDHAVRRRCGGFPGGYYAESRQDPGTPQERITLRWYFEASDGWARATATTLTRQLTAPPPTPDDRETRPAHIGPSDTDYERMSKKGFVPASVEKTVLIDRGEADIRVFRPEWFSTIEECFAYGVLGETPDLIRNVSPSQHIAVSTLDHASWQVFRSELQSETGQLAEGFITQTTTPTGAVRLLVAGVSDGLYVFLRLRSRSPTVDDTSQPKAASSVPLAPAAPVVDPPASTPPTPQPVDDVWVDETGELSPVRSLAQLLLTLVVAVMILVLVLAVLQFVFE